MRMRHVLLTSAASAGLFLTASYAPQAYAQKGVFLSPASQWAVTKVDANAPDQSGYCAVARRFDSDAIMTVARNQGDETSFALDLQRPVFNTSQQLKITLDPGAGQQREYSIEPASSQAFVVKLGRDEAFFNAVERTGLLRVEAAGKSYVFNISDIGVGETKLNSCLASAVQPAAGDAEPIPFPTQIESSSNKAFIDELNARIESLESQNDTLKAEIVKVEQEAIDTARVPVSASTPEAEALRAENIRLKAALQTGQIAEQSEKMRLLEADNKRLMAEISEYSDVSGQVEHLQDRVDALLEENIALEREAYGNTPDFNLGSLEGDIYQLKIENESLRKALSENASNGGVSKELAARIKDMEAENRSLKEQALLAEQERFEERDRAVGGYRDQIAALEMEIRTLQTHKQAQDVAEQEIASLQKKLISLRSDNALLQQDLLEKSGALKDSERKNDEIAVLSKKNVELKAAVQKSLDAHSLQGKAIKLLEKENAELKADVSDALVNSSVVEALNSKLKIAEAKLQASVEEQGVREQKLAALMNENTSLKEQLQASVIDSEALVVAQNDISLLTQELAAKDATIKRLGADSQLNINVLEQELARANETLETLEKSSETDIVALKKELEKKDATIEKLGQDTQVNLATLQEELSAKDAALSVLEKDAKGELAILQEQLAVKDAELQKYEGVPHRLKKLLAAYKQSKSDKAALEEALLASADESSRALAQQKETNTELVQKLAAAEERNTAFESKLEGLQNSVIAMSRLNEEVKELHFALAQKQGEVEKLKVMQEELTLAQAENKELKEEKDKLVLALEETLKMSEQKIAKLEGARLKDAEIIASLERQKSHIIAQNNNSSVETEKLMDSYEEMMAENDKRNRQHVEAQNSKARVEEENKELRFTLASMIEKVKAQAASLRSKDEKVEAVLAQNEALRGQLDMASQLMASGGDYAAKSDQKASAETMKPQGGVILASAKAPRPEHEMPPVEVRKAAPKPNLKPAQKAKPQKSIAEELADIMPAAGDEVLEEVAQAEVIETPDVAEDAQDFMERDLNQAQIYEEQLKRSIHNQERIQESQAEAIDVEDLSDDPVTAVIERVAAPEATEAPVIEEVNQEPITEVDIASDVLEAPSESVEVQMSQDPFEGIKSAEEGEEQASRENDDQTADSVKESVPLPARVKQPKSQPVEVLEARVADVASVSRVLKLANVSDVSNVQKVDKKDDAYQWRAGSLYGSGEQRRMSSPAQFDGFVKDYLAKTEARCPGDFAIVPDNSKESGSMRVDSYEIACIGDGVSSSASLIFYNEGDIFTVLAHETEADKMDEAMAVRDQIFMTLSEGRDS